MKFPWSKKPEPEHEVEAPEPLYKWHITFLDGTKTVVVAIGGNINFGDQLILRNREQKVFWANGKQVLMMERGEEVNL